MRLSSSKSCFRGRFKFLSREWIRMHRFLTETITYGSKVVSDQSGARVVKYMVSNNILYRIVYTVVLRRGNDRKLLTHDLKNW